LSLQGRNPDLGARLTHFKIFAGHLAMPKEPLGADSSNDLFVCDTYAGHQEVPVNEDDLTNSLGNPALCCEMTNRFQKGGVGIGEELFFHFSNARDIQDRNCLSKAVSILIARNDGLDHGRTLSRFQSKSPIRSHEQLSKISDQFRLRESQLISTKLTDSRILQFIEVESPILRYRNSFCTKEIKD
jgi:hypothetical protein